jgi:putative colanic acid biosysnthesis UDP-glucose lipid carrier transferase
MELFVSHIKLSAVPVGNRRLLRNHETVMFWVQLFLDFLVVVGTLFLLTIWKTGWFPPHYRFLTVITVLAIAVIYISRGIYRQASSPFYSAIRVSLAWFLCLLLLLTLGFLTKTTDMFSRQVMIIWIPTALVLQIINHILIGEAIKFFNSTSTHDFPVLVIGKGRIAKHLIKSLNGNRWLRDKVIGVVRAIDEPSDITTEDDISVPLLGNISRLRTTIEENNIKRIYIALPLSKSDLIESLHVDLLDMNVDLIWAPDIFAMSLLNHSVREVSGLPLISLNESPLTSSRVSVLLKEIMDKTFAAVLLILLSPLMLAVAFAIKRSSPGPVIFKQDRHGFGGCVVQVWKFRSMKMHEGAIDIKQATREDPRITTVGKFIRRTSIDELPQLINVLQGTMSLVGPRPHAVAHNHFYSDKIDLYLARQRIKPGITGLAQVSGFRGETETLDKMQHRIECDLAYINNWSLSLDLKILMKTPFILWTRDVY